MLLHSTRQWSTGLVATPQPIAVSEIVATAELFGIANRMEFVEIVRHLDSKILALMREQAKSEDDNGHGGTRTDTKR